MHYTPKHASWLNPAEIEASRVSRECLGRRRIGHFHTLKFEVAAWRARADREARPIRWTFTVKDARRVFRYDGIVHLRAEAREKLLRVRPRNLSQASRISGITPADVALLILHLDGKGKVASPR